MNTPTEQERPPVDETYGWDDAARETYRRLQERAEADTPPAWQPTENGEELMGILVGFNEAAPTKYGSAPVVTIKAPDDQVWSVWLLHAVLRREFERARPSLGEMLLIRYQGRVVPEGGGNEYASYVVVLDRPVNSTPDWDRVAVKYGDSAHLDAPVPQSDLPPETAVAGGDADADDIPF